MKVQPEVLQDNSLGPQVFPTQAQTAAAEPWSWQLWRKVILGVIATSVPDPSSGLEPVVADMKKRTIQLHLMMRTCVLSDCSEDSGYMLLVWGVDISVVGIIDPGTLHINEQGTS